MVSLLPPQVCGRQSCSGVARTLQNEEDKTGYIVGTSPSALVSYDILMPARRESTRVTAEAAGESNSPSL